LRFINKTFNDTPITINDVIEKSLVNLFDNVKKLYAEEMQCYHGNRTSTSMDTEAYIFKNGRFAEGVS
jgi:hypothetical protein